MLCAAVPVAAALAASTGAAPAAGITNSSDDLRDGWYPDQPSLAPDTVAASSFGQLWSAPVDGQVYAQPLVDGRSVVVATERNEVASLDAVTGAKRWSVHLGTPFPASAVGTGCSDLSPDLGVTGTPVIDPATHTIYLAHKAYAPGSATEAAYYLDALDGATGAQRPGFPVRLSGTAQNAPDISFNATYQLQRPGLLLLDGVVYAAFGGHCDFAPYQGWVFGVSTAGAVRARWSSVTSGNGAGIWQSGAGLMSDGSGRLFASTGNGGAPTWPTDTPSGMFGESVVRLDVQSDGTLRPGDFFAPSDAARLDGYDADFGSGGLTALPDATFGTSAFPHVAVAVGKAGYVYVLNRDKLGGIGMGTGSGDAVLGRVGPYGGVWSRPGVWPGDGGWIAIPTATPGGGETPSASDSSGYLKLYPYSKATSGTPALGSPIQSDDAFGFGSSAPVITSNATTSGSAMLWIVWAGGPSGAHAQLRAYDAAPVNGHLVLRRSWPIGTATKFAMPGVGTGRIYVGTRDGQVRAFGAPVQAQVRAPSTTFSQTTVGSTSTVGVKLTAGGTLTIQTVSASPSTFATDTAGLSLPATLNDGDTLTVPVDFTPTAPGTVGGTLTVTTDKGTFTFTLTGPARAQDAVLVVPGILSLGGAIVGDDEVATVTFSNGGGQPLTVTGIQAPGAPFSIQDTLAVGDQIGPGEARDVTVHYAPTAVGSFTDDLVLQTTAGNKTVVLSGSAGPARG